MRAALLSLLVTACAVDDDTSPTPADQDPRTDVPDLPGNQAPRVVAIDLVLGRAAAGEGATCEAQAVDPEGDPITLAWGWQVDGVALDVDTPTLDRSLLRPGAEIACLATPRDPRAVGPQAIATRRLDAPGGNILVILVDDLGTDKLDAYDARAVTPVTPTLDALAADGLVFDRAYAQSVCSPTRAALLTGRHPSRHGVGWWLDLRGGAWSLPDAELTIPELLAESTQHVYTSVALGKWHLVTTAHPAPGMHPLEQGFTHHAGALGNPNMAVEGDGRARGYYHWEKWTNGERAYVDTYMTTDLVDDALDLLPDLPEPWFAWVAFNAPHSPWQAPPEELVHTPLPPDASLVDRHHAMIEALDTELGRLLDGLDPAVLARTTVIFQSDNGSAEDVILEPYDPVRAKHTTYEGGIRVPMIVTGPLVRTPGARTDRLVHAVDLLPTVARIAGVELDRVVARDADGYPRELLLDGASWLHLLDDPEGPPLRDVLHLERLGESGPPPWATREAVAVDDRFKFVRRARGADRFFDLSTSEIDEGPNLAGSPLDGDAEGALQGLEASLDAWEGGLFFEWGVPYTPP